MKATRWPAVVVFLALAIGAVGYERTNSASSEPASAPDELDRLVPSLVPASALASTWFCAGGGEHLGSHRLRIANPGDEALTAVIEVHGAVENDPDRSSYLSTKSTTTSVQLPPGDVVEVSISEVVAAPFTAATVEVIGGVVAVEHLVVDGDGGGGDTALCADRPSETWYFAWGLTTREADMRLALFNPFPDDAVVDITFDTEDGPRSPTAFMGLVVPAESVLIRDIGQEVARRERVSTTITTRSGRVVVDRLVRIDDGVTSGISIARGATAASTSWFFADGQVGEDRRERFVIYNPGTERATVDLELWPAAGSDAETIEPFELTISPLRAVVVDLDDEVRVPDSLLHATTVRSFNDVPVVVERVIERTDGGLATDIGTPVAATEHLVIVGPTSAASDTELVIFNPASERRIRVSAQTSDGRQLIDDALVDPAGRIRLDLDGPAVVTVTSDDPVIVSRTSSSIDPRAFSVESAVPAAGSLVIPDPITN